ncbi:redox-regulated ATPase YchF [Chloroflexota bacterium]
MSIDIGIIGLAKSGRTTIFNALTGGNVDTVSSAPHIGTAKVPDARLNTLADIFHPKRVVPAEVRYIDVSASLKSLAEDKAPSNQFLSQLSKVDVLINVVRAFPDESIPHPEGSLDMERDISAMNLEITFYDLAVIERRLKRITDSLKGTKPPERQLLLREQELLIRIKDKLEQDIPVRELDLTKDELKVISGFQFLTAKPLLTAVNIGEEQLSQGASLESELSAQYARPSCCLTTICGGLEMELGQLENDAADELRAGFGVAESSLNRAIKLSYELLGLISFLTVGPDEVRAWPVSQGTAASKAAGKIHSDIERGFIRAEVIGYDDFMQCGSMPEARKKGLLRLEGKTYAVRDGDIINFLFNV